MTGNRLYQLMAIAAALACTGAAAQLYKCKGPDGKIVYSDKACEPDAAGAAIKVVPMATTLSDREKAMLEAEEAEKRAQEKARERREFAKDVAEELRKGGGYGGGSPTPAAEPYQMTGSDRDRIRDLEAQAGSYGANAEQKQAAQMQISRIRRGAEAKMSYSDRQRRDALLTDLTSTDREKRSRAMSELRANFN